MRIIDQADSGRILTAAASAIVVVILVVAFVIATLGLGYEGSAEHRPMPAPMALEVALTAGDASGRCRADHSPESYGKGFTGD